MAQYKATLAFAAKLIERGVIKAPSSSNMLFSLSKYHKYGLLTDDLPKDNPITTEALRRLPKEVFQERQFRLAKAIQVNANKGILPEAEWLKPEHDVSYLKPFIQQVLAEHQEKEDWESGKIQ